MLSRSTKMMELEAKVARLEKENSALIDLKTSLYKANFELQKNKDLFVKTCSDLVQRVECLEKTSEENLGVLEKL